MEAPKRKASHVVVPIFLLCLTVSVTLLLLLVTLLIWLSFVTGSMIYATLITAGAFLVASVIIYLTSVRRTMRQLRERMDTIYEVAHRMEVAYRWVEEKRSWVRTLLFGR